MDIIILYVILLDIWFLTHSRHICLQIQMIYDRRSNLEAEQKGKGTEDHGPRKSYNHSKLRSAWNWNFGLGRPHVCVCASTYDFLGDPSVQRSQYGNETIITIIIFTISQWLLSIY